MVADGLSKYTKRERPAIAARLKELGSQLVEQRAEELRRFRWERSVRQVLQAVAALPRDELAAMAETLVGLTSFKRRVSLETETVGGPVDVAVISKGDGFIWVKRKHYFPPELNPRYFAMRYSYGKDSVPQTTGAKSDSDAR